jgi:hypothetical protein
VSNRCGYYALDFACTAFVRNVIHTVANDKLDGLVELLSFEVSFSMSMSVFISSSIWLSKSAVHNNKHNDNNAIQIRYSNNSKVLDSQVK